MCQTSSPASFNITILCGSIVVIVGLVCAIWSALSQRNERDIEYAELTRNVCVDLLPRERSEQDCREEMLTCYLSHPVEYINAVDCVLNRDSEVRRFCVAPILGACPHVSARLLSLRHWSER